MLGVNPLSARHENVVPLAEGDTVVLYTDGLVEHRHSDFDEGVSRLMVALADVASLPLERLCDELLARLVPENHEDDVALLAIRLHT